MPLTSEDAALIKQAIRDHEDVLVRCQLVVHRADLLLDEIFASVARRREVADAWADGGEA